MLILDEILNEMARNILSLDEFKNLPSDFLKFLDDSIQQGFDQWQKIRQYAASITNEPLCYDNTSHCNCIQDHIEGRLKTNFSGYDGVKVDRFDGDVLGLLYKSKLFIRFNKLKEDFRTSTKLTESHKSYLAQDIGIPGLPDAATILWAGYLTDPTMSFIKNKKVVCWSADGLEWLYDFKSGFEQLGLGLPEIPVIPIERGRTSRVITRTKKRKMDSTPNG